MKRCVFVGVSTLLCFAFLVPTLFASLVVEIKDKKQIYYGSEKNLANPGILEIQKVYDQMPSYQEAMKHPDGSAKRIHGLKKASDEFREMLSKYCKEKKYEIAAEKGALTAHDSVTKKTVEIPDLTQELIKAIPGR